MIAWLNASLERHSELAVGRSSSDLKDYSFADLWSQTEVYRTILRDEKYCNIKIIGLLGQRSFHSTAVVMACLFEGIAFVPLNPKWPLHRLEAITRQLKISLVFFEARYDWVELPNETEKILLSSASESYEITPPKNIDSDSYAYFISTSGSTGMPKTIGVTRRNLDTFLKSIQTAIPISSKDRLTQMYDLSFDLGVGETVWGPLMGASLHPFEPVDTGFLNIYFKTSMPTIWSSTPSFLRFVLANDQGKEIETSLRLSLFCGEQLMSDDIKRWKNRHQNSRIFNLYGPTESTIYATFFEVRDIEKLAGPVPVGMPLPNVLLKLDSAKSELLIGGEQVTLGYFENEVETHEKFFVDEGLRWFRSGDKVELLGDGNFLFKGRLDRQVKVQGYRIELDEIESCAAEHLKMECAVEFHNNEIVLYTKEKIQNLEGAKKILSSYLPKYALPTQFIHFANWPIDANGKISRKLLGKLE